MSQQPNTSYDQTTSPPPSRATTAQYRGVYLLVWPSAFFKAHWAIFIPDSGDLSCKRGKYVHARGALDKGFDFELVRGHDPTKTRSLPNSAIEIGWVPSDTVVDTPTGGKKIVERLSPTGDQKLFEAKDKLELFLSQVPVPSKSLNSATSVSKGKKVELSDCAWWVTRCVEKLVEQGILTPPQRGLNKNKMPLDILESAPRH